MILRRSLRNKNGKRKRYNVEEVVNKKRRKEDAVRGDLAEADTEKMTGYRMKIVEEVWERVLASSIAPILGRVSYVSVKDAPYVPPR